MVNMITCQTPELAINSCPYTWSSLRFLIGVPPEGGEFNAIFADAAKEPEATERSQQL